MSEQVIDMGKYQRQTIIPQIGEEGQQRLKNSRVTVIGAGGLGCPVLTYLVEAGVGNIRIIDSDSVSLTNLNRQFLHREADTGRKKTESAEEKLRTMNSSVKINTVTGRLTEENAEELIVGSTGSSCTMPDVVIDCVDNIKTRLVVSEWCMQREIPLVEGGISGFYGFVTVISRETACLECLGYHSGMDGKTVPALGTTAGVIGSLQAAECLKILLGAGNILYGRMLQYDGLESCFDEIRIQYRENCRLHLRAAKGNKQKEKE